MGQVTRGYTSSKQCITKLLWRGRSSESHQTCCHHHRQYQMMRSSDGILQDLRSGDQSVITLGHQIPGISLHRYHLPMSSSMTPHLRKGIYLWISTQKNGEPICRICGCRCMQYRGDCGMQISHAELGMARSNR